MTYIYVIRNQVNPYRLKYKEKLSNSPQDEVYFLIYKRKAALSKTSIYNSSLSQ